MKKEMIHVKNLAWGGHSGKCNIVVIRLNFIIIIVVVVALRIEFMASCLLNKCSVTWAMPAVLLL
jgi:hypothetical protein